MHTKERFSLTLRWVCFAILLTASALRLASEIDLRQLGAGLRETWPKAATVEAGTAEVYPTMRYIPPAAAPEAAPVTVVNRAGVEYDADELLRRPIPLDLSVEGPVILIVHTHASEAYTPTPGAEYEPEGEFRTTDTSRNVVRVGQAVADRLNELGIPTLHDTTLNDVPGYNDAYERTLSVTERYLAEYPSIQMVIDLHRDALADEDGNELPLTAELDGQNAAQLLLVMGSDTDALPHPNWKENLAFALRLQSYCAARADGLFRNMELRAARYNEHTTPCSLLLEVGTAGNTLPEALRSAGFFADCLAGLLQSGQPEASGSSE